MTEFKTLAEFAAYARERAQLVEEASKSHAAIAVWPEERMRPVYLKKWEAEFLHPDPNEDDCRFCRAMATCPAMAKKVEQTIGADFDKVEDVVGQIAVEMEQADNAEGADAYLAALMDRAGMVEDWIKAVRAEVERRLLAGQKIPGWGLELGRQGPRKWTDDEKAEEYLRKTFRLTVEQSYDMSVISPTSAEKLLKTKHKNGKKFLLNKKQWEALQKIIDRRPPVPSVKPAAAIKQPWVPGPPVDDFSTEPEEEESLS